MHHFHIKKHGKSVFIYFNKHSTDNGLNKAIIDDRLRPWCATQDEYVLVFIAEQNLVNISAVVLVIYSIAAKEYP